MKTSVQKAFFSLSFFVLFRVLVYSIHCTIFLYSIPLNCDFFLDTLLASVRRWLQRWFAITQPRAASDSVCVRIRQMTRRSAQCVQRLRNDRASRPNSSSHYGFDKASATHPSAQHIVIILERVARWLEEVVSEVLCYMRAILRRGWGSGKFKTKRGGGRSFRY